MFRLNYFLDRCEGPIGNRKQGSNGKKTRIKQCKIEKKRNMSSVKLCVHGMQSLWKICTVCCISSYFGVSKAILLDLKCHKSTICTAVVK
jgi:hypothetical protein